MNGTVFIARHGSTAANDPSNERFRGMIDFPLSGDGIRTSRVAARALLPYKPTRLYSSPMSRALDTAKIMSVTLGLTPLRTTELLPWDIGDFSGKRIKDALPEMIPFQTTKRNETPPGSNETFNQYLERVRRNVTRYLQIARRTGENILLVSHARMIYVLEELLFGHEIPYQGPPAPGGVVRLSGDVGKVVMDMVYEGRDPKHVGVVEGLATS